MIRKFLNTLAVHIEGIRHPPKELFATLFSCQCPCKEVCQKLSKLFWVVQWLRFIKNSNLLLNHNFVTLIICHLWYSHYEIGQIWIFLKN
jgi:hypothetical protein